MLWLKIIASKKDKLCLPTFRIVRRLEDILAQYEEIVGIKVHEIAHCENPEHKKIRRIEVFGEVNGFSEKAKWEFRTVSCIAKDKNKIFEALIKSKIISKDGQIKKRKISSTNDFKMPRSLKMDEIQRKMILKVIKEAKKEKRRITLADLSTREPITETLEDNYDTVIFKKDKDEGVNYKIRVGNKIISFIMARNLTKEEVLILIRELFPKFIGLMEKNLRNDLNFISDLSSYKRIGKIKELTESPKEIISQIVKELAIKGKEYCDIQKGQINIKLFDENSMYKDYKVTIKYELDDNDEQWNIDIVDYENIPLVKKSEKCQKYSIENVMLVVPGLGADFYFESNSFNNLLLDGPNCFRSYVDCIKETLGKNIQNNALQRETERDGLTLIYNHKTAYNVILNNWYEKYDEDRENKDIGLAYIDLDEFKPMNDYFDHNFGDAVLKYVAGKMQKIVNEYNAKKGKKVAIAARVGGDEFAIIAKINHINEFQKVIIKFHDEINEPIKLTMIININEKNEKLQWKVDLSNFLYQVSGIDKEQEKKRQQLFSRFAKLIKEQNSESKLDLLTRQINRILKGNIDIDFEHIEKYLNRAFNKKGVDINVVNAQELIKETIVSNMKSDIIKRTKGIIDVDNNEFSKAIENFLYLQFENIEDTDDQRKKFKEEMFGQESIEINMYIKMSVGIASAKHCVARNYGDFYIYADKDRMRISKTAEEKNRTISYDGKDLRDLRKEEK